MKWRKFETKTLYANKLGPNRQKAIRETQNMKTNLYVIIYERLKAALKCVNIVFCIVKKLENNNSGIDAKREKKNG